MISSANDAGADIIGGDELIEQIKETGLPQCDVCLSTTVMHNKVKKIQKILRAKMPTEKRGKVLKIYFLLVIINQLLRLSIPLLRT